MSFDLKQLNFENTLHIYLNDVLVGSLSRILDDRNIFVFDQTYLSNENRPTLSLFYKARGGGLLTQPQLSKVRLPPFFSNLLPEGHLRQYLAEKLGIKAQREFFLLAALGDDLPGAVRIVKTAPVINRLEETFLDHGDTESDHILKFSLAGIQLKFSAILESSGALTIPIDGTGGSWIVKVPNSTRKNIPEAEFSMLTLARAAGLEVPEFKLIPTTSILGLPHDIDERFGYSFAIKRFDRGSDNQRIHMEDFAQVFGLYSRSKYRKANYDQIAEVIYAEAGEKSLIEYIGRLVFTIAIGNGDMHVKNWTLLYKDGHHPELSPAYDQLPTFLYIKNDRLGLNLGGENEFASVTLDNFRKLAARARVSERLVVRAVKDSLPQIKEAWEKVRLDLPMSDKKVRALEKHMNSLSLFKPLRTV